MKRSTSLLWLPAAALLLWPLSSPGTLQEPQESSSKHPPEEGETRPAASAPKPADQPRYDPLRAQHDVEVGTYYMRRGKIEAAIDRFQDAIESKPNYALPFRLLGEAQEKKGLKREAIKSYTRYLEIYPHAEDKGKVLKRIDRLREATEKKRGKSG
jgi:tetratricopeptide (TPR) repeat protein